MQNLSATHIHLISLVEREANNRFDPQNFVETQESKQVQ